MYNIGRGGELPPSIAFRGDLYLLFERGDIVRRHCRTWKDRDSGELIDENGERWLTKTQRPKRSPLHPPDHAEALPLLILLHKAGGSASEWFSGGGSSYATYADKGRFIILAPQSPSPTWGTGPKNWGYDYVAINRALEEAFARCAIDRNRAGHWWFLRRRVVRAFTWPG